MATAISPPEYETEVSPTDGSVGGGRDFDEGWRGGGGDHWGGRGPQESGSSNHNYRLGMWLCMASITMLFAGLSSAYVFRLGASPGWVAISLPRVLVWNTGVLLASSLTMEISRRARKSMLGVSFRGWLAVTALLGILFLILQLWVWRQLVLQGVYLNTSPHSSFFYLITGTHGLHLFGGMIALLYVLGRAWTKRVASYQGGEALEAVAMYWHFMAGLWVYLFVLLFVWRY